MYKTTKPSEFDRIVKEINATEIPSRYVIKGSIEYYDGTLVELVGDEISHPIPVNTSSDWQIMGESFGKMKNVRIFIDTDRLSEDVNAMVDSILGKYL